MPIKLGMKHRVVVRSFERAYYRELWPFWKSKWAYAQNHLHFSLPYQNSNMPFLVCHAHDCERLDTLYAKLRVDNICCLALTVIPTKDINPLHDTSVFDVILDTGIPIALWLRKGTSSAKKTQRMFESFLSHCALADLPQQVWKQRLNAAGDEGSENSLTLLWDDPDRLPPDVSFDAQLSAPKKKGSNDEQLVGLSRDRRTS